MGTSILSSAYLLDCSIFRTKDLTEMVQAHLTLISYLAYPQTSDSFFNPFLTHLGLSKDGIE